MDLRLTFALRNDEYDGDAIDVGRVGGLTPGELPSLTELLAREGVSAELKVEPGSVGKGAAGPGVQLVIELAERGLTDTASVLAVGGAMWALVRNVRARRERRLETQQPEAIGTLALAAASARGPEIAGGYVGTSVCFTGGGPGMGTDVRDVWATPVVLRSGDVWVIFSSPSGLVLGEVTVPAEWTADRGELRPDDVVQVFRQLNPR